jgi:UDP-N-acetylmuramoyl-tripeptide--D-alanyl-D-alanine ligase
VVCGYSIDSRTVAPGELFFAVRGDRLDGHDFVTAALKRGAVAAVVSRARVATLPDAALAVPLLITEDPLLALQALAAHVRRQWGTASGGRNRLGRQDHDQGSSGRGSGRKVQCAQVPGQSEQRLRACRCNYCAGAGARVAVVEMGMNHPGEIAALARIASPDWGVVTNVGMAHIENFADGQAGIARAKFELVAALPSTAWPSSTATILMFRSSAATFRAEPFTLAPAHAPIRNCLK